MNIKTWITNFTVNVYDTSMCFSPSAKYIEKISAQQFQNVLKTLIKQTFLSPNNAFLYLLHFSMIFCFQNDFNISQMYTKKTKIKIQLIIQK